MLRAEVGDQLVRAGATIGHSEVLGVVIRVHGESGEPPFTIRWYESGHASTIDPDPDHFWIRSQADVH